MYSTFGHIFEQFFSGKSNKFFRTNFRTIDLIPSKDDDSNDEGEERIAAKSIGDIFDEEFDNWLKTEKVTSQMKINFSAF